MKEKYEEARELYQEALACESECVEALYNLGLVCKTIGSLERSLDYFKKLNRILPNNSQVIFQMASIYEQMGQLEEAQDRYRFLVNMIPSDPSLLQRLGSLYARLGDDFVAHQNYAEVTFSCSSHQVLSLLSR